MAEVSARSRSSSGSGAGIKRRHSPSLSLDLDDLPGLTEPSAPSNTLLITVSPSKRAQSSAGSVANKLPHQNLSDPLIFTESNLSSIRDAINAQASLQAFIPLKSFRRIIAIFHDKDAAILIRGLLDGEAVLGNRIRVYFGEHTDLEEKDQHLSAPDPGRLFFISPPPSPPMGWEMRNEDPPNKEVHAHDLASALDKLNAQSGSSVTDYPPSPTSVKELGHGVQRSRSSTIVFSPAEHGGSPGLPAIAVEDTSEDMSPVMDGDAPRPMAHTARPPVELME